MSKIEKIQAREILDSRGNPTVEAEVECRGGAVGVASVPSGASTGTFEAYELRDGDERRYGGQGVLSAVANVATEIHAALLGKNTDAQEKIDQTMIELDGTPNKKRLGANAILAVSLACARAQAEAEGLPLYLYLAQLMPGAKPSLPVPLMNLINGGQHAHNKLSVQEFQIIPFGFSTFAEALRAGAEIYHALQNLLLEAKLTVGLGDEGGYDAGEAALLDETEEALAFMLRAIELAGYAPGSNVALGMDLAASEFYDREEAVYRIDEKQLMAEELSQLYQVWQKRYPLVSLEDPFAEEAWEDWQVFTKEQGEACQIIGDDLFVTNASRIQTGIKKRAANAVLIKPNQIGTLTETVAAISLAKEAGLNAVISHRSGETADTFIADLAVASGAGQIKTGAPARGERVEKYNRLLAIEERLRLPLARPLEAFRLGLDAKYRAGDEMVYT